MSIEALLKDNRQRLSLVGRCRRRPGSYHYWSSIVVVVLVRHHRNVWFLLSAANAKKCIVAFVTLKTIRENKGESKQTTRENKGKRKEQHGETIGKYKKKQRQTQEHTQVRIKGKFKQKLA